MVNNDLPRRCIAIDFDGCLFEEENYPSFGRPIWPVIYAALREQERGSELILYTLREGAALDAAIKACKSVGLEFDFVNENANDWKEYYSNDPRKIAATEYWDDRAKAAGTVIQPYKYLIEELREYADQYYTGAALGREIEGTDKLMFLAAEMIEKLTVELSDHET